MLRPHHLLTLLSLVASPAAGQSWDGDGLDPAATEPHFSLDASSTEAWDTPILGDAGHRLRLRRSGASLALTYESTGATPAPVQLAQEFVFMPGARASAGATLVCWTVFTGGPTADSAPGTPDPRTGSAVSCRLRSGASFSAAVRFHKALVSSLGIYLMKIEAAGNQFRVVYYEDKYGTFFNQPDDFAQRIFARTFDGTTFGPPVPASL
jgi:hypothetical protein